MSRPGLIRVCLVFLAGTAGSVGIGAAAFRGEAFSPGHPFFQVVTIGALLAGILSLVRAGMPRRAMTVAAAYAVFQLGTAWTVSWPRALTATAWSAILCVGMVLVSMIYDLLARQGFRLGKFVILGPLLAGVFVAATPVTVLRGVSPMGPEHAMTALLLNCFLGIVIGDGVGLGAEVTELVMDLRASSAVRGTESDAPS